jgi:hypothetical protein
LKAERLKAKGLKIPAEPREYRIELAYSIVARLLYGTYGESTIRKSITVLLERNYIKRYQETKNSVPCYVLNIKALQAALDKQAQEAIADPSQETEVSNLTPEESEMLILTSQVSNLQPEMSKLTAKPSKLTPNNISNKRDLKKEDKREEPTIVQETSPSPIPSTSLSPLSSKNEKKTDSLEEWYSLFDRLLQEKGYPSNFRVPRNEKNATAIQELISMNATPEQAAFVLNHIWNDKDSFWRQHRGKITTIASQFTTRVCEMHAPAPKQRTSSGLPNWTADKTMGAPTVSDRTEKAEKPVVKAEVVNEPSRTAETATAPVQPALPVGYTRLKLDKAQGSGRLAELVAAQKKQRAESQQQ